MSDKGSQDNSQKEGGDPVVENVFTVASKGKTENEAFQMKTEEFSFGVTQQLTQARLSKGRRSRNSAKKTESGKASKRSKDEAHSVSMLLFSKGRGCFSPLPLWNKSCTQDSAELLEICKSRKNQEKLRRSRSAHSRLRPDQSYDGCPWGIESKKKLSISAPAPALTQEGNQRDSKLSKSQGQEKTPRESKEKDQVKSPKVC